jgi:hypothetical protein
MRQKRKSTQRIGKFGQKRKRSLPSLSEFAYPQAKFCPVARARRVHRKTMPSPLGALRRAAR